jgi:DNA-binding NarL/FixJ family response regulator
MIRVVLAEDNALLRAGLLRLFADFDDIDVLGAAADHDEAVTLVTEHEPDVVITDIRMPPTDSDEGLRLAQMIADHHPEMGVVVLSHHLEPDYALRLLRDGTSGRAYLLKDRVGDPGEIHRAVIAVAEGGSLIDAAVVDALLEARRSGGSVLDRLTHREGEVLAEIARGRSNRAVAEELGISERAVEKHASSIFVKLGLSEETERNRRVAAVLVFLGADDAG